jgi:undecaprenyl-diphosphatase
LIELDLHLTQRLRIAEKPGIFRATSAILAHSGDSWYWLGSLALLYWLGTDYWKVRAVILIIAILVAAGVVAVVKRLVPRRRPEGEWGKFYRVTDPGSFPSGHTVRAFMLAVIMLGVGPLWLGLVLLVWAPLVGLARVAMGVHYLSDVLAGSLLGTLIGIVVLVVI